MNNNVNQPNREGAGCRTVVFIVIFLIVGGAMGYKVYKNKQLKGGKKKYTIGTYQTFSKSQTKKKYHYYFQVNGTQYYVPDDRAYRGGDDIKRVIVEYLENDPSNCRAVMNEPVTNDTLGSPENGWDRIPEYIRD